MWKSVQAASILALLIMAGCGSGSVTSSDSASEPSADPTAPQTAVSPSDTAQSVETDATGAATAIEALPDTLVIPGERVGPVTLNTSREDLAQLFGEDLLTDVDVPVGEGFTESGTKVDLGSTYSFSVIWTDSSRSQPMEVRDLGTAWTTPEGIGIGTEFSELQDTLGQFDLYGFAWDYGGTVVLDGTALDEYSENLVLRVKPEEESADLESSDYQSVLGETLYESTNPSFENLDLSVDEMIVYLAPPTQ